MVLALQILMTVLFTIGLISHSIEVEHSRGKLIAGLIVYIGFLTLTWIFPFAMLITTFSIQIVVRSLTIGI